MRLGSHAGGIVRSAALLSTAVLAHAQADRYDALAHSPMFENRPAESRKLLREGLLFQRATQGYLWALPLINTLGMKVGSEAAFGAGYNVLPVWKQRLDAKTLATTPNSDVICAMSYHDLGKDGAMVFEASPGLQGILLDFRQHPIPGPRSKESAFSGDVGFPGPDGVKGGKFLILPPGPHDVNQGSEETGSPVAPPGATSVRPAALRLTSGPSRRRPGPKGRSQLKRRGC